MYLTLVLCSVLARPRFARAPGEWTGERADGWTLGRAVGRTGGLTFERRDMSFCCGRVVFL